MPRGTQVISTVGRVTTTGHEPHRGLELASQEVRAFADAIRSGTVEIHPSPDGPWHTEIPELVGTMPLDRGGAARIALLGHLSTLAHLWSVTDHLYALSNCVDDRTLFSVPSLTRIVMEAAASAAWLDDDATDSRTTLARHVRVQQKSIRAERDRLKKAKKFTEAGEMSAQLDALLAKCRSELGECATALDCLGRARNEGLPSKSQVVSAALAQVNLAGLSKLSYGAHSSIVHSEPYMLLRSLDATGKPYPNMLMQVSMTVGTKLAPVVEALLVTTSMVKTVSHRWDTTIELGSLDGYVQRVTSIGKQYKDDPSERLPR